VANIKVEDLDEQEVVDQPQQPVEEEVNEPMVDESTLEVLKSRKYKLPLLLILSVVLVLVTGLVWSLKDRSHLKKEVNKLSNQSQVSSTDEAKKLSTEVNQLVVLPTDETPSIATVADATKLKQQSSGFENAQTGDKLLIYAKARQIIVYRPSVKKVVNIVQITIGQTAPTTGTTQKKQ
jgi:hypothetical protein